MDYGEDIMQWAEIQLRDAEKKVSRIMLRSKLNFPYAAIGNEWTFASELNEWTNGFWPGILWISYVHSGDEKYKLLAEKLEKVLDVPLAAPEDLGHDVGFVWSLASVANYKITGNQMSACRAFRAAKSLASRYNPVGYFRSWNDHEGSDAYKGLTIVDNMMNLPIMYWAAKNWDCRQAGLDLMAINHSETVLKYMQRPDGSVNHIIKINPVTGEFEGNSEITQGKNKDSSWTRGQAWLLYGFALGARYTDRQDFLDAAKRTAHYFIAALPENCVPPSDFRYGDTEPGMDSSAGACAACGLLELASLVSDAEKQMYIRWAIKIAKGLCDNCTASREKENILDHASVQYNTTEYADVGLIYGDYFYMELLYRLAGGDVLFW